MKNLLTAALPALALLALGGCATTGAVTSTEDDGVYYSSKDRTTVATAPAATGYQNGNYGQTNGYGSASTTTQAPASADENTNPDYQGGTAQQGTATGNDYYDDSYNSASPSGFGQNYTGPGVSSYNYTPNWSVSPSFYGSPYGYGSGLSIGYGYGGGFGGYSPFGYGYGYPAYAGFYDPFYSPFYSPFGYGYGSGFSIGFGYGFGNPYYGGFGYPGYAYGYPYGGRYYGGGYGDYGYGGARSYVYKQNIVNGGYANGYGGNGAIMVGRRESRAVNAVGSGGMVAPGNAAVGSSAPGGRQANGGATGGFNRIAAPGNQPSSGFAGSTPGATAPAANRAQRFEQATANPNSPAANDVNAARGWGRANNANNANPGNAGFSQPRTSDMATPAGNAAAADGRRGGFFRGMFSAPANQGQGSNANAGNQGGFSQPQRSYSQPADRGGFSQPQRSYSQPSQPSQPSFGGSRGGFGGGGGGGGSFGGGGGGGGGGGRRGR